MADNKQLEDRILKLEKLLETRQQLKFPLDIQSQTIINEKKLRFEAEEALSGDALDKTLRISIDGKIYKIDAR